MTTFLNIYEIESALIGLHNFYPFYTQLIPLPNKTYGNFQSNALLIRANPDFTCRPALVFVSGVHAREWGGPDTLVYLAADLLEAYSTNSRLEYGGKSFSAATIRAIVNRTDIVVFPDQNPDGRWYSSLGQAESDQACWRKNRNPFSSGSDPKRIGVDNCRNYDFLWDFPVKFAPNTWPASTDPGNETYIGTGPFSEPETRNVQWLLDHVPNAAYFVDVHSYSGDVLYPWGDDQNQTVEPSMSFMNPDWDGKRGVKNDVYGEYLPAARLTDLQTAAAVVRDGVWAVRGQSYVTLQAVGLYTHPISGTSIDWAFSREFVDPSRGKLTSLAIEFNKNIDFFPTWLEMIDLIADVDAGLIALCKHATPPYWAVFLCWLKRHFWAIWHRVSPPELWGPYGPWARFVGVVKGLLGRVAKLAAGLIGRGRGS
jgi:murein tripeptide amidase MpaA